MLTYEVIENCQGIITSIEFSDGSVFNTIDELVAYCRVNKEFVYGELLHRIAVAVKSVGVKTGKEPKLRTGLVARIKIGKTTLVDMTDWKMDLKADAASVQKVIEIEKISYKGPKDAQAYIGSSPSFNVNNSFYAQMGWIEALNRAKWAPTYLDGWLCSSQLPKRGFRPAYTGGLLGSPADPGKIYTDIQSFDITSCYPFSALVTQVPMGASFNLSNEQLTKMKVEDGKVNLKEGFGFIGLFYVKNAVRKSWVKIPMLRDNKGDYVEDAVIDHIGIVSGNIRIAMCQPELELFNLQYNYDSIAVQSMTAHRLGSIPEKAANFILKAFDKKNTAPKDSLERETAKTALNTIIGFWGTDPFNSIKESTLNSNDGLLYVDHKGSPKNAFAEYTGNFEAEDEKKKVGHAAGKSRTWDFRWATYIIAAAKLRICKAELACYEAGLEVVYCDTDSLKVSGTPELAKEVFDKLNEDVRKIYNYDGIGLWINESEGYHRAVFRGVKVYVYENEAGDKVTKIAGSSKEDSLKALQDLSLEGFADAVNPIHIANFKRSPGKLANDPFGAKETYNLRAMTSTY